jgi:hypothetical protein
MQFISGNFVTVDKVVSLQFKHDSLNQRLMNVNNFSGNETQKAERASLDLLISLYDL